MIDFHSHLVPASLAPPGLVGSLLTDVDALLAEQQRAGVTLNLLSRGCVPSRPMTLDEAKLENEFLADLSARHPRRLVGLATTDPFAGDDFLRETERAIKELGLKGIGITSSRMGEYLDSPRARPLFELAISLDVPVFVHPPLEGVGGEAMKEFGLAVWLGRPLDTTVSAARLVLSGALEGLEQLKLVLAHMGGAITFFASRAEADYWLRQQGWSEPSPGPTDLPKRPIEYLRQFYVDTMNLHPPAMMCAIQTLGADHVVMGSDILPVRLPLERTVEAIRGLPIASLDQEKIFQGNARRLLKL